MAHNVSTPIPVSVLNRVTYPQCNPYQAVISSISLATEGPRSLLRASTAQDVVILTPSAVDRFDFKVSAALLFSATLVLIPFNLLCRNGQTGHIRRALQFLFVFLVPYLLLPYQHPPSVKPSSSIASQSPRLFSFVPTPRYWIQEWSPGEAFMTLLWKRMNPW